MKKLTQPKMTSVSRELSTNESDAIIGGLNGAFGARTTANWNDLFVLPPVIIFGSTTTTSGGPPSTGSKNGAQGVPSGSPSGAGHN